MKNSSRHAAKREGAQKPPEETFRKWQLVSRYRLYGRE